MVALEPTRGMWVGDRLKDAAAAASNLPGLARLVSPLEWQATRQTGRLWVLTYHRVGTPGERPDLAPGLISASPAAFARQMAYVAEQCHAVTLDTVLAALHGGASLPPRAVLITFDDAYEDFGRNALPVLSHFRLPAVMFVPTAYPDQPQRRFWWDRLHQAVRLTAEGGQTLATPLGPLAVANSAQARAAFVRLSRHVKALPHAEAMALVDAICDGDGRGEGPPPAVLGWQALRALQPQGITLAAHSQTHPLLHRLPPAAAQAEIRGSLADLARETGRAAPAFAYPGGGFDATTLQLAAEAGVQLAFTTQRGVNDLRPGGATDPLCGRRINVGRRVTDAVFRLRLTAWSAAHWPRGRQPVASQIETSVSRTLVTTKGRGS